MKVSKRLILSGTVAAALLAVTFGAGSSSQAQALTKVRLQLKWVTQAQFAGYYAAADQGYYKDQGLDVEIKAEPEGGEPRRAGSDDVVQEGKRRARIEVHSVRNKHDTATRSSARAGMRGSSRPCLPPPSSPPATGAAGRSTTKANCG